MRRTVLTLVALAGLAASPAWASFTGSLYYTNFGDHHVRRLDIAGNTPGATADLATLPGADGIIYDPLDNNKLLVAGQFTGNIYRLGTTGGAVSTVNTPNGAINYGAFHMAVMNPVLIGTGSNIIAYPNILTSSMEGAVKNGLSITNLGSGLVDNRLITGTAQTRVSGIAVREVFNLPFSPNGGIPAVQQTVYITDGPEPATGGKLYTVNLGTNAATAVNVQNSTGGAVSQNLHGLWIDKYTKHLFATGAKHLEEIDLDAIGGPKLLRSWDLSGLIPESEAQEGHTDQVASDDFGNLFVAANSGQIIYLDLTGAATPTLIKKVDDIHLDDLVVGPAAVPEPSTLVLAGLGLVGVAVLRKRG